MNTWFTGIMKTGKLASLGVLFAFGLGHFAMTDRCLSRAVKEIMWHLSLEFSGEVRIGDIHGGLVCTWLYVMCWRCFCSAVQLSSLCMEDSQYTDCALPSSLKIIPSHPHNLISCSVTEFLISFFSVIWKTTENSMHCTQWPQGQVHAPQWCQVNNYGASVRAKLNRIEKQFWRAP